MNSTPIHHIWFDFSETIAFLKKERHDRLRYETYAELMGKPITETLIAEYEDLYKKFNHSNAAIFRSFGQSPNFWSNRIVAIDPGELYELADPKIPQVLTVLRAHVPISLFSNIELERLLPPLGIQPDWFTHILSAGMVKESKPALDGFYKMMELSNIPAQEILYIGDHVGKDIRPAKQVGIQAGIMWKTSDEADYPFEHFEDVLKLF